MYVCIVGIVCARESVLDWVRSVTNPIQKDALMLALGWQWD